MGNYARITVLMICYKQELLIKRALDSILCQRQYGLKEIIISDDNSPDNTWGIIQQYKERYPEIIYAHRNGQNLGIYPNVEKVKSLVKDTDFIIYCAGDDAIEDGYFKAVQEVIMVNNINPQEESVALYGDFKTVMPTGKEFVFKQTLSKKGYSSTDLLIKGLLKNRSSLITYALFKRYKPLDLTNIGRGEFSQEIQQHILEEKRYYVPAIGSIYYASIGVSRTMFSGEFLQERIDETQWELDTFPMNADCRNLLLSRIMGYKYSQDKKLVLFLKYWFYYYMSKPGFHPKDVIRKLYYMLIKKH